MKKSQKLMDENYGIVRFTSEQMIECPSCSRLSPPNRMKCLYCGANLPLIAENLQLRKRRKIEAWEKGFNLVFIGTDENYNEMNLKEVAKLTDLKEEELEKVLRTDNPLPIARVESNHQAEALRNYMKTLGLLTLVVPDESLSVEKPPQRLRRVEFIENIAVFTLFNSNKSVEIESKDLSLLMLGLVFKHRIESIEKRKKKKNELKESYETAEDETLIDIYTTQDQIGYRIIASGFDFSTLGEEKEKLAHRNVPKLIEKFCEFAPQLKIVDDYSKLRHLLGKIWQVEEQRFSLGLRRKSFSGYELIRETFTSNLNQFTKYSRLQSLMVKV